MQTEVRTCIPSPQDYLDAVTARMIDSAMAEDPDPEAVGDLVSVFMGNPASDEDMLNLLAFAQGCHAAADVYRARNNDVAALYTAMGQDLITKAMLAFAGMMAVGIAQLGVTRH